MDIATKHCKACATEDVAMSIQEAQGRLVDVPGWQLDEAHQQIERTLKFRDFRTAMGFVQKIGELAEEEGHHPDICFGWGYATIKLKTHSVKGLSENDFIMAAKINSLEGK